MSSIIIMIAVCARGDAVVLYVDKLCHSTNRLLPRSVSSAGDLESAFFLERPTQPAWKCMGGSSRMVWVHA